jgi:hypothetical protein
MKLLIYIFLLINLIEGKQINIKKPSILILEYYNNYNMPISIEMNGYKFRESTIMPNSKGIFPLKINPGNYFINNNISIKYKLFEGEKLSLSKYHLKDKLIKKNKLIILDEIKYFKKNKHILNIRYLINLINRRDYKINYNLILKINDITYNYNNISKKSYYIVKDKIKMDKGYNKISILSLSNIDYLCSCPSMFDGFYNGRNLFAWLNTENENNNNLTLSIKKSKIEDYVLSIVIEEDINFNNNFIPFNFNIK